MKKSVLILAVAALAACEKAAEIPVEYEGDRIVVNSLVQEDSVVYLRLTRSQPPGASSFPEIAGASVKLTGGGETVPLEYRRINDKGYYVSEKTLKSGVRYHVEAAAAGLPSVQASDTLPRRPLLREPFAQKGGSRVKVYLTDMPGADRYRIRLFTATKLADGRYVPDRSKYYRFDPSYNNSFTDLVTETYHDYALIPDDRFDGREILVVLQTRQVLAEGEVLLLEVNGLTNASWKYLKSVELQKKGTNNVLMDPAFVFSNVDKGYGIFAGLSTARVEIPVK